MYLIAAKRHNAGTFPIKVPITVHSFIGILMPVAKEVKFKTAKIIKEVTVLNNKNRFLFFILVKK